MAKKNATVSNVEREKKSIKSGGFIGKNECTSKGYVERERRRGDFSGLALLASQRFSRTPLASLVGSNK